MTYAMRLNGGDLVRDGESVKHDGGFAVTVLAQGTAFGGTSEPLVKTMNTLMTNGSWETISRFGNRPPAIVVQVEGETPDGLNAGEVWLSGLMGSGALEWLPPDQQVWTVFDVVSCYIDLTEDEGWDLDETKWVRKYRIPIKALPHARSQFRTITPALPLASTPLVDELVTDGSTLMGWSAAWTPDEPSNVQRENLTPTVVSGRVHVAMPDVQLRVTLAASYNIGAPVPTETAFLRVDYRLLGSTTRGLASADVPGKPSFLMLPALTTPLDPVTGAGTAWYRIPAGTRAFTMRAKLLDWTDGDSALEVDQIRRVSRLPDTGTDRQKLAAITPGGSAPAEGSLHVSHPTEGLGKVLVATYPLGRPSPDLMQYRTGSEDPIDDATQISGQRIPLGPLDCLMKVPSAQLPIRGRAALWAKVDVSGGPATVRYEITPLMGYQVGSQQTDEVTVGVGDGQLVPLGLVTLPGTEIGSAGEVAVSLSTTVDSVGTVEADKVWAFGQDEDSALLIVDCGTGEPEPGMVSNHLWINAPTPEKPAGEVLVGTNSMDVRWPQDILAGPEVHRFGRDGVGVTVVTCGATDASTDFAHFKRWTHHAAEES